MPYNPKVSIVIRTLNEAVHIGALLVSIKDQSYGNYEIILVDSGSFDGTVDRAKRYCDQIVKINQEDFTFGFAINYGIKHARGELICIVSAHTKPLNSDWLSELVNGFDSNGIEGKIAMTYGKQLGVDTSNFSEKQDFFRRYQDEERTQFNPNYFCNNANAIIRKDLWIKHPFDEALTGLEDIEWAKYWLDRGYSIIYKPQAAIFHVHHESPQQIRRRFWREAIAARSIGILPLYKIFMEIPRQFWLGVKDFVSAKRMQQTNKWREIKYYRFNKLMGTLKALSQKTFDLKDYSANYAPFDYKVVEIQKPNVIRDNFHSLEPTRPNEVLIKIAYAGICETDFEVLKGALNYYKSGWATYPIVPGHEFSGIIVRVGSKIQHFKIGDRVVGQCILSCGKCQSCLSGREIACTERKEVGVLNYHGAYAEYISLPSQFVHKIPDGMSLVTASSIEPLAVVLKGLRRIGLDRAELMDKETVLIIGGGPIGHLAARVSAFWGHRVTLFDRNQQRLELISDLKDVSQTDQWLEVTSFSTIIECTGKAELVNRVINESSTGSTILLLGLPYSVQPLDLEKVVTFDKRIVGSVGSRGEDFRSALKVAESINMNRFNELIFDFDAWKQALENHTKKRSLKVKLKMAREYQD